MPRVRYFEVRAVDRLLFHCARTVSELHLFERLRLLFGRKQIPHSVVGRTFAILGPGRCTYSHPTR
jgi:hypothetical protein